MTSGTLRLGVVADDVTGACDLAGRVAAAGLPTVVTIGVPADSDGLFPGAPGESGVAVVALKSRTAPVAEAVRESTASAERLLAGGATLLYQKYCSTFDSTARGNIGQVADALARVAGDAQPRGGDAITIGTPATPGSGRTQERGDLLVNGIPLAETPMRDHPLTPMRDSDVVRVLQAQTPHRVAGLARSASSAGGADAVAERIRELAESGAAHILTDASDERDLDTIARALLIVARERPVVAAGAAGVATALARTAGAANDSAAAPLERVRDRGRIIVSGSASSATRAQNAAFAGPRIVVDPHALAANGDAELDRLRAELATSLLGTAPVLVTATTSGDELARAQQELGTDRAATLVEDALAHLAAHAVAALGVTRMIVAGGETSGAVVARLGIDRLRVGEQVAPGVPWTTGTPTTGTPTSGGTIALLLKSGNFGGDDLFSTAWEAAP
ncbi:3-oxo-tetronate kinase [Leifsonia sp. NPDC058292]|uniref:3-oxo-tetronate kinase n=1 Tax=Leifsonia sp. NPDC058292 TaxID=3346428 RepID=UPI0036DA5860